MFQSAIHPERLWREIIDRHYRNVTPSEARAIAMMLQGYGSEEAASLIGVTSATVRRHVADLCHRVFEFTAVPQERDKLKVWAAEHLACCIPLVREMIENDRRAALRDRSSDAETA